MVDPGCIKTEDEEMPSMATDSKASSLENPLVGSSTIASELTSSPPAHKLESLEGNKRAQTSSSELSSQSRADGGCDEEEAKGGEFVDDGESTSASTSPLPLPEVSSI